MKRKLKNNRNLLKKTAQDTEDRPIDFTLVGRALGKMLIKKGMSLLGWNSSQETVASNQTENENHSDVPPDPHPHPDDQHNAMEDEHYFNHEVDVNINAIDNERPQKSRGSASKKTQTRRVKKTGALDARSYCNVKKTWKKKSVEKGRSISLEDSKRAKLKLLKKRLVKLQNDVQEISKSLDDELVGSLSCPAQNISSRTRSSVELQSEQKDSLTAVDSASKSTTDRTNERFRKRQKQRTQRKTLDLINNYEAGPSHAGQLETKKHQHNKTFQKGKTEGRLPKTKTSSSTLSPRLPALVGSKDSEDWPSLPGTDRPKCQMKEAAKEMIKNKQSGSLTKICRKRWSDVVLRRSEESSLCDKSERVDSSKRTWASVASHGTNRSLETSIEVSSQSIPATNTRKKKHSPVEAEHSVEDREDNNTARSLCSADAVKKKTKKSSTSQSKEEMDQTKRKGRVVEKDMSAGLSSAKSCQVNQCCIDKMPVVYTKPVGAYISLNDGLSKKDTNKGNNRTVTPKTCVKPKACCGRSVPSKESSDLDICDGLSTFSFESISEKNEGTCKSLRKKKPRGTDVSAQKTRHRKIGAASCQKDNHKSNQEEVDRSKQKKVSTKYRALMRGESGRLDAKAITEVTTRARRNETLQGDKELNRTLLKKQRQQRQQTSYNMQRSPPKKAKVLDLSPEVNDVSSPAKNPPENRDKPSTSKQRKCDHNKSDKRHSSAAPDVFRQIMRADAHKPVYAESAPELNRQPKGFILEIEPANSDALDMGWWHAYLRQKPPAPDGTEDDFDQDLHRN
ncbi:uncharacterized protein LOC106057046 [Biomphalaria glabrata]|uniref:Uncharacterized protein LOC106057046 n=1 Tax=Biomphalaria glabrata TaxID=6526 RepID=A0A9U8E1Y7_BIOGL|nr:uncharacterized protein LOC106057046 [Biomphalaria glabrata]KAI8793429.1 hypothetical protein BgiBS90_006418 [Biomphalaria glabrata]